jgi:predicted nucleic acid-binding protein
MNGMVILVDMNVILDSILRREPFVAAANTILTKCLNRELSGYLAGYTVPTIFYILRKRFSVLARRTVLSRLCSFLDVAGISKEQVLASIDNDRFSDLEDCLQAECAEAVGADYIITRNVSDFATSTTPAILPEDFLVKLRAF